MAHDLILDFPRVPFYATVAELADALVLEASGEIRRGSSPFGRTKFGGIALLECVGMLIPGETGSTPALYTVASCSRLPPWCC